MLDFLLVGSQGIEDRLRAGKRRTRTMTEMRTETGKEYKSRYVGIVKYEFSFPFSPFV